VRLIACPTCHSQYDVTDLAAETFTCRCGEAVENRPPAARDAVIRRCGACGALATTESGRCDYCNARLRADPNQPLSLICPECYARNAEDGRFCTACGVTFSPYPLRIAGREVPCPACGSGMPARAVAGVAVHECGGCHGLWVPGTAFDDLAARAADAQPPTAPGAPEPRVRGGNPMTQRVVYRRCPECDAHMQRRNFGKASGVIIDRCRDHGTWLDADELERIAGFLLGDKRPESLRAPQAAAARQDGRPAPLPADPHVARRDPEPASPGLRSLAEALFAWLK
jgi:Zn-finger nucleic acid-binding protein